MSRSSRSSAASQPTNAAATFSSTAASSISMRGSSVNDRTIRRFRTTSVKSMPHDGPVAHNESPDPTVYVPYRVRIELARPFRGLDELELPADHVTLTPGFVFVRDPQGDSFNMPV